MSLEYMILYTIEVWWGYRSNFACSLVDYDMYSASTFN
jgi:hypothetical protein